MNTGKLPADHTAVTPYLIVNDADAALNFYEKAFGFKKMMAMPGPDGKTVHGELMHGSNCRIMVGSNPENAPTADSKPSVMVYCYVEDVDKFYSHATANGAKTKDAPVDKFYGDRTCMLIDPFGHHWGFATHVREVKPEDMKSAMENEMKQVAKK